MKGNLLCLDLPVFDIDLVTTQNYGNVVTDPGKIETEKSYLEDHFYIAKDKCGEEVINERDSSSSSCINGKLREKENEKEKPSMTHLQRSRCHVGTFLYVKRAVTSNMMIAHCP